MHFTCGTGAWLWLILLSHCNSPAAMEWGGRSCYWRKVWKPQLTVSIPPPMGFSILATLIFVVGQARQACEEYISNKYGQRKWKKCIYDSDLSFSYHWLLYSLINARVFQWFNIIKYSNFCKVPLVNSSASKPITVKCSLLSQRRKPMKYVQNCAHLSIWDTLNGTTNNLTGSVYKSPFKIRIFCLDIQENKHNRKVDVNCYAQTFKIFHTHLVCSLF